MQIISSASKRTNPHLNQTLQAIDHLLPLGPRTVTLKTRPRGADDKSVPHTEPVLFQPRNLYITADALRRFGGSCTRKEVWVVAGCTRWLQATCEGGVRIAH